MSDRRNFFRKHYTLTAIVLIAVVGVALAWLTQSRMTEFDKHQHAIATESVNGISSQVEGFVAEKNRLVKVFAR